MLLWLILGFVLGAVAVVAAEATALLWILGRLRRSSEHLQRRSTERPPIIDDLDRDPSIAAARTKKGFIWMLEADKVAKISSNVSPPRGAKEQKKNKEVLEVIPTKKYAKMRDHLLILFDLDGSQETIDLREVTVLAISATDFPSRKWAKRFPIKLESKNSVSYRGSKICYLYLDTSSEKESWCKALRIASCPDREKLNWYAYLNEEFNQYLTSLHEYHSYVKHSTLPRETKEKTNKADESSSKVRLLLKKLARKTSKSGPEYKIASNPSSSRGDKKIVDIRPSVHDTSLGRHIRASSTKRPSGDSLHDTMKQATPFFLLGDGSQRHAEVADDKIQIDGGTMCWNFLFSRLFFDAKTSMDMKNLVKARIQRTLSNMRIPSYIAGVTCTGLDLGNLPPHIHNMRVTSMDLNEAWAMELDIEYLGGISLDIETRLEVREQELQKGILDPSFEPNSSDEATADLLEGIEQYGTRLKSSKNLAHQEEKKNDGYMTNDLKQSKGGASWTSNYMARWKAIAQSLADQVSQVPLSLTIKIASLRGTLRVQIKSPPSDQIWYTFTSMPDIEWNLESSVGDRKITSSQIALLIGNRFKAAIRDSLVHPNCECVLIPWMLADKDDWAPCNIAPYIWTNRESVELPDSDACDSQPGEHRTKMLDVDSTKLYRAKSDENVGKREVAPIQNDSLRSEVMVQQSLPSELEELKIPLLGSEEGENGGSFSISEPLEPPSTSAIVSTDDLVTTDDDAKPKKMGRRERMLDLRKRMGEKFEEKRRHIEEKSRIIVEKMRENSRNEV